ncbi:MAG: phospholipase D-like domain-containing protein [Oligoflexia bacterium]|nr:phospholipase D-like domain-containing protein [Oligoflexia bacterium]
MRTLILASAWIFALAGNGAQASMRVSHPVSLKDRLATQEFFKAGYARIHGSPDYGRIETFQARLKALPKATKGRAEKLLTELDPHVPAKLLMPLVHWRVLEPSTEEVAGVIAYHVMSRLLVLRDFIDHPLRGSAAEKEEILAYFRGLLRDPKAATGDFFLSAEKEIVALAARLASIRDDGEFAGAFVRERLTGENFLKRYPFVPEASYSWLGFIPGNKVELVNFNDRSMERIQWFNDRAIFAGGTLDWSAPYMKMPTAADPEGHVAFQKDPIFMRIREMVDAARDSIFIDIFLFGGTMGGTLSRYLIDQTLEKRRVNPNFRVLLLHDYATNYNMKDEMMPIFEYIRDRIEREPEVGKAVTLLQANIQRHPPGIPFGISKLVPKTDATFAEIEKRNTYYESKIDHSKVIVIDANTESPQAYFGSKNWSDHSGGYYYDDALWIAGPAAAAVQASYYDDIDAALTTDPAEQKWFFYKEQGFGNGKYVPRRKEILDAFRVLRADYPAQGREAVRIAEANVDGRIKDARNILVDMIRHAEKRITMEQLFIYDKYINDALIKRKLEVPSLEVRILADHNGNFGMNGFPNTMFIREMLSHGIEVRARKTIGMTATFKNGETKSYHQENHRKITAVDGRTMMVGSSNLNPDTLQGSFREFGAQVFDAAQIGRFEEQFLKDWNDPQEVAPMEMEHFRLKLGQNELSPAASALINDIGALLVRAKDDIEGKY